MPLAGKRAKQSKTAAPGASATSKLTSAATSKPGVKATSGKSSASAASAAVKCAVCEQDIVDGKDQALFCEGLNSVRDGSTDTVLECPSFISTL